ncbi:MAG: PA2779 family protein [Deltaproteobacteria bacterium]|nr:PA2779 family protein [Deltaproteobacteria bacterium]
MEWIKKICFKQIAVALAVSMFIIGSIPSKSLAYVAGSSAIVDSAQRAVDMENAQRVLESKLVSGKLAQAGLSMTEIKSRLDKLSDADLHQFASQLNSLYPGGDGLGIVIALLVIVILVLVILKLSNRKLIIQ